jgi:hypothetical protein
MGSRELIAASAPGRIIPRRIDEGRAGLPRPSRSAAHAIGPPVKHDRHSHEWSAGVDEEALPSKLAELSRQLSIMIPAGRIEIDNGRKRVFIGHRAGIAQEPFATVTRREADLRSTSGRLFPAPPPGPGRPHAGVGELGALGFGAAHDRTRTPRGRDTTGTRAARIIDKSLILLASPTGFEPVLPP